MLPARVKDYASSWLDDLCTSGRTMWTRLSADGQRRERAVAVRRCARRRSCCCRAARRHVVAHRRGGRDGQRRAKPARRRARNASPTTSKTHGRVVLRRDRRRLPAAAARSSRTLLAELVVRGRINCDSYAKACARCSCPRPSAARPRRRARGGASRWSFGARGRGPLERSIRAPRPPADGRRATVRRPPKASSTRRARCCAATASSATR